MKKIILFHAPEWCGHCKTFLPIWESIKEELDPTNKDEDETKYWTVYDDNNKTSQFNEAMEKYEVAGFPTIIIEDTETGEWYKYEKKPRTKVAILKELKGDLNLGQSGGGKNDNDLYFKMKYLKYKAKYLELVDKLLK